MIAGGFPNGFSHAKTIHDQQRDPSIHQIKRYSLIITTNNLPHNAFMLVRLTRCICVGQINHKHILIQIHNTFDGRFCGVLLLLCCPLWIYIYMLCRRMTTYANKLHNKHSHLLIIYPNIFISFLCAQICI